MHIKDNFHRQRHERLIFHTCSDVRTALRMIVSSASSYFPLRCSYRIYILTTSKAHPHHAFYRRSSRPFGLTWLGRQNPTTHLSPQNRSIISHHSQRTSVSRPMASPAELLPISAPLLESASHRSELEEPHAACRIEAESCVRASLGVLSNYQLYE